MTRASGCGSCVYRRSIGDYGRVQCSHPRIMAIQEQFPERKPGLIAVRALNEMGKALAIRINLLAYRNPWFSWPWCYDPASVDSCSGFDKEAGVRGENEQTQLTDDSCKSLDKGENDERNSFNASRANRA